MRLMLIHQTAEVVVDPLDLVDDVPSARIVVAGEHHQADVVVLARYMQILPPAIVEDYQDRIINIHPSLLPHFPGPAPYRQAWEEGVRVTGCTAHFVTEKLDAGPIILQDVFHINIGIDSVEDVRRNGQELEGSVLSKAVRYFLNEQLVVLEDRVAFKPGLSELLRPA